MTASEDREESNNGLQRYFSFNIDKLTIGINKLNEISRGEVSISKINQVSEGFTTTETVGGILNITRLDTRANIIAGTFSFQAAILPTNTPGKIINVTEGRFDITY